MPKLLFGQAYYLRFDSKLWAGMQPYPPLGTMYAASYMRQLGYKVALFDAMLAQSENEWEKALDQQQPDYAIIYEDNFNYLSKMCLLRMREACFTMISMAKERGLPVIICGSDATDHTTSYLQQGADYVIRGEGEATLAELLAVLTKQNEKPINKISGISYPSHNPPIPNLQSPISDSPFTIVASGDPSVHHSPFTIHSTPPRPDIKNLNDLPFPAWDLIDVEKYRRIWLERHGYYSMNMVTTRGCPYHCNWCAKPIWGQRYNSRSPENVAAEMKWLQDNYQPDHIWFADDIMGLKPKWLETFSQHLIQKNVRIPFKSLSRADLLLRGDTIPALAQAGCDIVWIGAESGSQKILDGMEKGTKVEQIYEAAKKVHEAGFKIAFFLQFGYPGETRADIEMTLQMVRDCQPDDIGMSVSYPLPGTTFHQRVKDELGLKQNWHDSADLEMLYEGPFASDFYRHLHTVLHKEYRARKTWGRLGELLRQPHKQNIREIAGMVYNTLTLPIARFKLNQLAKLPHQSSGSLPPGLSHEAASTPSPQL